MQPLTNHDVESARQIALQYLTSELPAITKMQYTIVDEQVCHHDDGWYFPIQAANTQNKDPQPAHWSIHVEQHALQGKLCQDGGSMDWLPVLIELKKYMPAIQRRGFSHLTLIDKDNARRIAAQKIVGSNYALRSGVVPIDAQGWRFPLQHKYELDKPYEGDSMALTILVPWQS